MPPPIRSIDLNCDLGELEGESGKQLDLLILPWITSANVACGGHAGSPQRMRQLAAECSRRGLRFGAHPGYVDRANFGRKVVAMSPKLIYDMVCEQVELASETAAAEAIRLTHVKPHGALYNLAASDPEVAAAIARAVRSTSPHSQLIGLSGSELIAAGEAAGLMTCQEVFADRAYHSDGTLVSRDQPKAVLHDAKQITNQVIQMLEKNSVISIEGQTVPLIAETVCVHGDTAGAIEIAQRLYQCLRRAGWLQ